MDAAKKARTVLRSIFTKSLNNFLQTNEDSNSTLTERQIALQLLESRMLELESVNAKYFDLLIESETSSEAIEAELEAHEAYKQRFLSAKAKIVTANAGQGTTQISDHQQRITRVEKPFKRPTLEIPKFDGCISKWLQFWTHFRKYHEDSNLPDEEKLDYLKLSVEKGSKADKVISGYPTTPENYMKAFEALKSRFGREKLLIEYYTRELLSLALQNALNKGRRVSIADIYDKLSAHIRSLETLGVTTENCATMLYPLVESSLPEEILRTWQRNSSSASGSESDNDLQKLLDFLKLEVENEERISMAVSRFGVQEGSSKRERTRETNVRPAATPSSTQDVYTASALYSGEERRLRCIFCSENHENATCEKAKSFTYVARKNIVKENNCCFKCLKPRHRAKDCKVRIICASCGNRHSFLVCPPQSGPAGTATKRVENSEPSGNKIKEHNLASFGNEPDIYLQTLRVVLYSDNREKIVRALIDCGSQRSYIRSEVAEYLGYASNGNKEIIHSLFGGANSKCEKHNVYLVRAKSIKGDYACNFEVMDQQTICESVPSVKKAKWLGELRDKNIFLCDLDLGSTSVENSIDLLIGAYITGKKYDLANGLTVTETRLEWTRKNEAHGDRATAIVFYFVSDAKVFELWKLDVLGIRNPIERSNIHLREDAIKENFLQTVKFNANKCYSVDLPWVENHALISNNFNLAKNRLENTVKN